MKERSPFRFEIRNGVMTPVVNDMRATFKKDDEPFFETDPITLETYKVRM